MNRVMIILALSVAGTACGTKVGIVRMRPAPVNLAPANRVAVTVSSRQKSPAEAALAVGLMMEAERRHDPEFPVRLLQSALNRHFQGGAFALAPPDRAQCGIHVKISDWAHATEEYTPKATKENPHPATSMKVTGLLNADATISCGHLGPTPILRTYALRRELPLLKQTVEAADHDRLLETEVEALASTIAREVTPQTYAEEVEIDDSAALVKPAVERIRAGDLDTAHALLLEVVRSTPSCAPAHYDLGVIEEARGDYQSARERYLAAQQHGDLSMYDRGLARVDRAVAELQALGGQ